jgi:hypothetical protein
MRDALCIGDLKDPALSVIPKQDLDIVIRVARVFRGDVASGFEDDKASVTTNTAGKRFCGRIGKLADYRIDLSPDSERDGEQGYNC